MIGPAKFARGLAWLACAALATEGCRNRGQEPARAREPKSNLDAGAPAPTWVHDIAPLLARRCGACHGDAATAMAAPPPLATYEQAREGAASSLRAVRRRMMPPFGADDTGLCGTWSDAAWLTDDEIATFGAWVEQGAPRGEGTPLAAPAADAPIAEAAASVDPGVTFVPGVGARAYRCFLVTPPRDTAAALLTGVTVASEPRAAVRQANLFALASPEALRRARARDAAAPEPGWPCFGGPVVEGAALLASWSRNTPAQGAPDGAGLPLPAARAFIMQVRYDLIASAPGTPVRARWLLGTAPLVGRQPARLVAVRPPPFTLSPRQPQARVRATWTVDRPTTFRGLIPRMHTLGRTLDLEVSQAGGRRCLAHLGHWDMYDQQLFRAAAPVPLGAGDTVALTCTFATTSRDTDTKMGEAPDEEQCLAHLYLVDESREAR